MNYNQTEKKYLLEAACHRLYDVHTVVVLHDDATYQPITLVQFIYIFFVELLQIVVRLPRFTLPILCIYFLLRSFILIFIGVYADRIKYDDHGLRNLTRINSVFFFIFNSFHCNLLSAASCEVYFYKIMIMIIVHVFFCQNIRLYLAKKCAYYKK